MQIEALLSRKVVFSCGIAPPSSLFSPLQAAPFSLVFLDEALPIPVSDSAKQHNGTLLHTLPKVSKVLPYFADVPTPYMSPR